MYALVYAIIGAFVAVANHYFSHVGSARGVASAILPPQYGGLYRPRSGRYRRLVLEVGVYVAGYPDSDYQERVGLAWRLERELRGLDVQSISRPSAVTPEGAKGSALEWAQLVVAFGGSLPVLVAAVRSWVGRHDGASITLEINGDKITVEDASANDRQQLIDTWIARHGG